MIMAKDKYRFEKYETPDGKTHYDRVKVTPGSKKFAKGASKVTGALPNMFGLLVLILLFRYVIIVVFDLSTFEQDGYFHPYYEGSELMYFDVFQWLQDFVSTMNNNKNAVTALFASLSDVPTGEVLSTGMNGVIFFLNCCWNIFKIIWFLPLEIIGFLLGQPMSSWSLEGGWIYACLQFNIPYTQPVDWNGFWDAIRQGLDNIFQWSN